MRRSVPCDLNPLFNPRTIAVVGASNAPGKMGNLFVERLKAGFDGTLRVVNPGTREVAGITSHPSIAETPGTIDLLLALVPGRALVELMESCPKDKVRYLAAIPSGFAEASAEGRELQRRLQTAAAVCGAKVLGPNIVGLMNCERGLNASMIPVLPPGGPGLSCLTQSGGFGMTLAMYALDHGLPVAKFCDLGNMADLQVEQVLRYFAEDEATHVIGLFLEAVDDIEAFCDALGQAARRKPVVLAVLGRSDAGIRASRLHLGLAANLGNVVERLPPGVVHTETGQALLDACKALLWQRPAAGRRLAVVTGTGGIGAELADLATRNGLELPEFSADLQARLRAYLPPYAAVANPVDATPIWREYPKVYPDLIRSLDSSGEVDAILVSITDVPTTRPDLAAALVAIRAELAGPLCIFWGSRDQDLEPMRRLQSAGLPCYRGTQAAVGAALALAEAGRRSRSRRGARR